MHPRLAVLVAGHRADAVLPAERGVFAGDFLQVKRPGATADDVDDEAARKVWPLIDRYLAFRICLGRGDDLAERCSVVVLATCDALFRPLAHAIGQELLFAGRHSDC